MHAKKREFHPETNPKGFGRRELPTGGSYDVAPYAVANAIDLAGQAETVRGESWALSPRAASCDASSL